MIRAVIPFDAVRISPVTKDQTTIELLQNGKVINVQIIRTGPIGVGDSLQLSLPGSFDPRQFSLEQSA